MTKTKTTVSMNELSPVISETIESGGEIVLRVTGNSMLPLWRDRANDVLLKKADIHALKKGDIPLYKRENGQYVLHRIHKVNEDSFDMLGDAQYRIERGLKKDAVIALCKGYYTEKGKYIDCGSKRHKIYSAIWRFLLPIRRYIMAIYKRTILKIKVKNDGKRNNEG